MTFSAVFNCSNLSIEFLMRFLNIKFNVAQKSEWYWYIDNKEMSIMENYYFFGYIRLIGPYNQEITIGENLLEYDHMISWKEFLIEESIQTKLRNFCFEFKSIFSQVLYLPNEYDSISYVFEGQKWEDILSSLKKKFGDPVHQISEMYIKKEEYWYSQGYFLDKLDE